MLGIGMRRAAQAIFRLVPVLLSAGFGATAHGGDAASPVDLALVVAVDVSASMDRGEFQLQRDGYSAALRSPDFLRAILGGDRERIALAYVEWSGPEFQRVIVPWRVIDSAASAAAFADRLDAEPIVVSRGTSISAAIAFSAALLDGSGTEAPRLVIDVSGDGPNNYGEPVAAARDAAIARGIVVNGLPILVRPSPTVPDLARYYADCVIGGPGSFMLPVRREDELATAIRRKLVLEVAGESPTAIVAIADTARSDCLAGERARRRYAPYYPGLDP